MWVKILEGYLPVKFSEGNATCPAAAFPSKIFWL
jgi:hypothetical protein